MRVIKDFADFTVALHKVTFIMAYSRSNAPADVPTKVQKQIQ
jgi:hypothetical protein